MVADMVADTVANIAPDKKQTKKLADVESIMVADMQVDKVADIIKTMCIKTEMLKKQSVLGQSCLMQSDLCVFQALRDY